jgi:hypothetical protein
MGYRRADEEVFFGTLASASARPQRSEESQGDGCPRPAFEGWANGGGRWFLRMRHVFTKNVYFCSGNFTSWIKAVTRFHVYFCLPGRKGQSCRINGLAENMSTFVYFGLPFTFGAKGFRLESTG